MGTRVLLRAITSLLQSSANEARLGFYLFRKFMHGSAQPDEKLEAAVPFSKGDGSLAAGRSQSNVSHANVAKGRGNGASDRILDDRILDGRSLGGQILDEPILDDRSLEERELESTLQLLVERAQYITGATGTALALPQGDEMVCRASAGTSAPAVGASLQVKSGLTGESILRRQLLRCDNAETDPRVNLEACRALGIASIVVLPLLRPNGDVRGLFELFSDHPYAFEERDLIALERMAALTQTALNLAENAIVAPKPTVEIESGLITSASEPDDDILDVAAEPEPLHADSHPTFQTTTSSADPPPGAESVVKSPAHEASAVGENTPRSAEPLQISSAISPNRDARTDAAIINAASNDAASHDAPVAGAGETGTTTSYVSETPIAPPAETTTVKNEVSQIVDSPSRDAKASDSKADLKTDPKDLTATNSSASPVTEDADATTTADLPTPVAMLRVQKCSACGFPVSEGRTLCLDCENKELHEKGAARSNAKGLGLAVAHETKAVPMDAGTASWNQTSELSSSASVQFVPAFLVNSVPVKESWLSDHVNILAILVFITCILVAIVIFR